MMEVPRAHSSMDILSMNRVENRRPAFPTRTRKATDAIKKLANFRIGGKLRRTRSMDMDPKPISAFDNHPVIESDDLHRSFSSGSSPGTSQGKRSMDGRPLTESIPQRAGQDALTVPTSVPTSYGRHSPLPVAPGHTQSAFGIAPRQVTRTVQPVRRSDINEAPVMSSAAETAPPEDDTSSVLPIQPSTRLPSPPHTEAHHHPRPKTTSQSLSTTPYGGQGLLAALITEERRESSSNGSIPPSTPSNTSIPPSLVAGPSSSRPGAPHLSSLPIFSPRFSIPGAPARLSPAIITRQPQYPILNLPTISPIPQTPTNSLTRPRSQSLRSMPALPMAGSEDHESADHDNAMLDDLEEEEDDGMIEDDDGDEDVVASGRADGSDDESVASMIRPLILHIPKREGLPMMKTSPLDTSFLDHMQIATEDRTPQSFRATDYFNSKQPESTTNSSPLLTPRPFNSAWTPQPPRIAPAQPSSPSPPPRIPGAWLAQSPRIVPMPSSTPITSPTSSLSLTSRPSMYHQTSRSMIDMTEMLKKDQQYQQLRTPEPAHRTPRGESATILPASSPVPATSREPSAAPSEENLVLGPSLRRQHSMPTFTAHTAPPPYPQFHFAKFGAGIVPRDEEGREGLPKYSNEIYLRAIMPRKMEFSAPGVQARDRKWRRTLCVLEGTAFRVYKCPPAVAGVGVIGNWWEKTVGVGDIAEPPPAPTGANTKAKRERDRERDLRPTKDENAPSYDEANSPVSPSPITASPRASSSSASPSTSNTIPQSSSSTSSISRLVPSPLRRNHRSATNPHPASVPPTRSRFLSVDVPRGSESSGRRSFSGLRGGGNSPTVASGSGPYSESLSRSHRTSTSSVPSPLPSSSVRTPRRSRSLWFEDPNVPPPDEKDLVHSYTLQNAESGLGSDYHKRRNVIRLRMEGEQFLLQAADIAGVVDWIEGFQAAANIALDLDERPMPKGPMFPRRRRRRRIRTDPPLMVATSQ